MLKVTGQTMSKWAQQGNVQATGRVRAAVENAGIALQWMSKGGPYDNRSLVQRMSAGNWYWRQAFRCLFRA